MASTRRRPSLTIGSPSAVPAKYICVSPASPELSAPVPVLNGTCMMSTPACSRSISNSTCGGLPLPEDA
ncbi:hypothetical protein G6F50_018738 [Rhizopus delemar]|uniref:Uncharacterized protein n=1 Tax=Rhizopus delemar TaxID=936053 RepID=A0A9P6XLJ4_9FUNG|nr:hypothetical protein G6F50_018738 [Rhizopus delemar]